MIFRTCWCFSRFFVKKRGKKLHKKFFVVLTQQKTEILSVKYILVFSNVERRRTLRTAVFRFYYNGPSRVSLRLGHARVLTTPRVVIHCARAASLPRRSAKKDYAQIKFYSLKPFYSKPSPMGKGDRLRWMRRMIYNLLPPCVSNNQKLVFYQIDSFCRFRGDFFVFVPFSSSVSYRRHLSRYSSVTLAF